MLGYTQQPGQVEIAVNRIGHFWLGAAFGWSATDQ